MENIERMRDSIIKPIDYVNGAITSESVYKDIYESINKVNWVELNNLLSQTIIDLNYPFTN